MTKLAIHAATVTTLVTALAACAAKNDASKARASTDLTQTSCVNGPSNQPDATFPSSLTGKLAYHSYASYGDGTSQIFIYDFSAKKLTQISQPSWGITDPMNAVFSPDGQWLAFMGITNSAWNIFLLPLGTGGAPVNMTNSTGQTRNEDPKFSADGTKLVFKQNKDVMEATLSFAGGAPSFASVTNLTNAAPAVESSMPFLSPDGASLYFAEGIGAASGIYQMNIATGTTVAFDAPTGLETYYPIVRGDGMVFYARWRDTTGQNDQIYAKASPSEDPNQLSINDCVSNNSDPNPVNGTSYVFFSSTSEGGYQLYLGDVSNGNRWSLSQFGVNADGSRAKLGSAYFGGTSGGTGGGPTTTLLSQGRPTTASSTYDGSLGASNAFDGDLTTRWDSLEGDGVDPQWIQVDLGQVRTINGVDLYWDAGALVYSVQVSSDAVTWSDIYSTSNGIASGHAQLPGLSGSGRYVRMYGTARATAWGYSLDEMQVWGY